MKNKKWILDSPFYVHCRKHDCTICHKRLTVKRIERTISSKSPEADRFDFSFPGSNGDSMFGNVDFTFKVFYCPNCNHEISINEMKKDEREQRRVKSHERKSK